MLSNMNDKIWECTRTKATPIIYKSVIKKLMKLREIIKNESLNNYHLINAINESLMFCHKFDLKIIERFLNYLKEISKYQIENNNDSFREFNDSIQNCEDVDFFSFENNSIISMLEKYIEYFSEYFIKGDDGNQQANNYISSSSAVLSSQNNSDKLSQSV